MEHIINLIKDNFIVLCILEFLLSFLIFYLFYVLFLNKKRKKNKKNKKYTDIELFINKYKLDVNKIGYSKVLNIVALMNSFIMAFTYVIICNIKSTLWAVLIGFVLGVVLTYSVYEIVGRYYKKKEIRQCIIQKK